MAPLTAATAYVLDEPEQTVVVPLIAAGIAGGTLTVTANVCAADEPQLLLAVTVTLPLILPAVAVIEVVVDVPVQPPGNVQVYEVAPLTAAMEYVLDDPEQTVAVPAIAPGVVAPAQGVSTCVNNTALSPLVEPVPFTPFPSP